MKISSRAVHWQLKRNKDSCTQEYSQLRTSADNQQRTCGSFSGPSARHASIQCRRFVETAHSLPESTLHAASKNDHSSRRRAVITCILLAHMAHTAYTTLRFGYQSSNGRTDGQALRWLLVVWSPSRHLVGMDNWMAGTHRCRQKFLQTDHSQILNGYHKHNSNLRSLLLLPHQSLIAS